MKNLTLLRNAPWVEFMVSSAVDDKGKTYYIKWEVSSTEGYKGIPDSRVLVYDGDRYPTYKGGFMV